MVLLLLLRFPHYLPACLYLPIRRSGVSDRRCPNRSESVCMSLVFLSLSLSLSLRLSPACTIIIIIVSATAECRVRPKVPFLHTCTMHALRDVTDDLLFFKKKKNTFFDFMSANFDDSISIYWLEILTRNFTLGSPECSRSTLKRKPYNV